MVRTRVQGQMDVAVVGAGIAGLVAARTLVSQGHSVMVFDKARGPGGRMATRRQSGFMFDHGAQYFTVSDKRFRVRVEEWVEHGIVDRWEGRIGVYSSGTIESKEVKVERFVAVPRMSALTRYLSSGLEGMWQSRVSSMHWKDDHWMLEVDGRPEGPFDAVIVTTPPAQAAPLLSDAPALAKYAETVTMTPCWALMLAFAEPLTVEYDGVFINKRPLSWAARNGSKPGRPDAESWVIHACPSWSKENLERDPAAIPARLLPEFFDALHIDPSTPIFSQAHRWRYARAENPLNEDCPVDAERRIALAGDWTIGQSIEAAFLSGLAAAHAVI